MIENLPLKQKLIFSYLLLSILPILLISGLLFHFFIDTLERQAFNQLRSVREIKKAQIEDFFSQLKAQTNYFVGDVSRDQMGEDNTAVTGHLSAFTTDAQALSDNPVQRGEILRKLFIEGSGEQPTDFPAKRDFYDFSHEDRHPFLKSFTEKFGYHDLFLVSKTGDIVYSVKKERNFGTNLNSEPYAGTALGRAFHHAREESQQKAKARATAGESLFFSDFEQVDQDIFAYVSLPLFDYGLFQGTVIFSISIERLNRILNERSGLGTTGETYLVGPDRLMRSQAYRQPETWSIQAVQQGKQNPVRSASVEAALEGTTDIHVARSYMGDEVLSAYAPVDVFGQRWALVAEISHDEAFAPIRKWFFIVAGIALITLIIICLIGYVVADTIAQPVGDLTGMAETIAAGDWDRPLPVENHPPHARQNELQRLAMSFERMRQAIREKMGQIERQNKELKQLDEFKNNLLANTSHELKTPLNGIIGLAESLLGQVPGPHDKTLTHIINSGRRLSNLVNDILDAARLRQKEIQIFPRPLNLRQIVDFEISISTTLVGNKQVRLINDVPKELCVRADQHRLQQIFQNLVGNAIKFTDRGEIRISAESLDTDQVEVCVTDTGIGIHPEDQERIFETFEQSESAANRSYNGTGLGLAITRQLVELHGGTIRVSSQPARGASFLFALPASSETPENLEKAITQTIAFSAVEEPPQTIPGEGHAFTILAVDDEPINLEIITNHLKGNGCHIHTASSGQEALAYMETRVPDLILLDVMMPEMDGYMVCETLRKQYSTYELPIVFLTARNELRDLVKGFHMGANDYLTKPFFKDELLARVGIQIELLISRKRITTLLEFSNAIDTFKSHEELVTATHKLLKSDPLIEESVPYFEGKPVHPDPPPLFENCPGKLDENPELLIHQDQMVSMFVRLSRQYALGVLFPKSSSEEWVRTLVLQIHKNIRQIRRIVSDPDNALVHAHILPALEQILYIRVEKNYCLLYKEEQGQIREETLRIPFKQVLFHTKSQQLFQIHRSYAINPAKITAVSSKDQLVFLHNNASVPAAKKYLAQLKKEYPDTFAMG